MNTMRLNQFILIAASVLLLGSCGGKKQASPGSSDSVKSATTQQPAETPAEPEMAIKKYPIKSAMVTFDNQMLGINQKTILYIDDYGAKEAEEKYDGTDVKEMDLCDGKMRYTINFKNKTAFTMRECIR